MWKTLTCAGLMGLMATTAIAHSAKSKAEARRAYYQLVADEMHTLADMAKDASAYDTGLAAQSVADLLTLSELNTADYFKPGTSSEDLPGETRALPSIWSNAEDFAQKEEAYVAAVKAFSAIDFDDMDAFRTNVQTLSATCSACHKVHRARRF